MKNISKFIALAIVVLNCSVSMAQVVEPVDKNKVANGGYDLVAYFTDNMALKGNAGYLVEFRGAKYQFASGEHQQMFRMTLKVRLFCQLLHISSINCHALRLSPIITSAFTLATIFSMDSIGFTIAFLSASAFISTS